MSVACDHILIVDDEEAIGEFIVDIAELNDVKAIATATSRGFLGALNNNTKCIFLDLTMPDLDGIEAVRLLAEMHYEGALVLMSGAAANLLEIARNLAISRGLRVEGVLVKPIDIELIETLLDKVMSADDTSLASAPSTMALDLTQFDGDLKNGLVVPFYQPKIDCSSGSTIGYEALARWQMGDGTFVGPNLFLDQVKKNGLIDKMTDRLLSVICCDMEKLKNRNMPHAVAVNLEASTLEQINLPERLEEIINPFGLSPDSFTLEVTENSVISELSNAVENLLRLRLRGFKLAIDDFGTGHSTLSQLRKLPFTQVKIDKSFVDGIDISQDAETIITSTVDLAQRLGLEMVVEGVETPQQVAFFSDWNPITMQGYFFAKPMSFSALKTWLKLRGEGSASISDSVGVV